MSRSSISRIIALTCLCFPFAFSQRSATLSGFVRDKAIRESLPFANICIKELRIGTTSNLEGYFAIPNIPEGEYEVRFALLGYMTEKRRINAREEKHLIQDIYLTAQTLEVSEVIVSAERGEEQRSTQTGRIVMQAKEISSLPAITYLDPNAAMIPKSILRRHNLPRFPASTEDRVQG